MLFNSWNFFFLVAITFTLYYLPFLKRFQVIILILSSFLFYAFNKPVLILLLIFTILLFTFISHAIFYKSKKFLWVSLGVTASISILAFFKYSGLIFKTFFPDDIGSFIFMIPLPIGISFFTFEGISLIVDSYRQNKTKEIKLNIPSEFKEHLQNTTLFISFFPHLIAGPIIKAHQFLPQIKIKYLGGIDWEYAFKTLVAGYFLKSVIADNLKDQTFWIAYPYFQSQSSLTLLVLMFGYSIQIFSDFAGYSLIALGIASLFGYTLPQNFNFPYISKSFSEFWQRWHISLSTWLKEYLYIPLGGNRKGKSKTYFNLMIVMLLGGLWHGVAWSYAFWGAWHGVLLAIERILKSIFNPVKETWLWNGFRMVFVFVSVTIAWLFFKLTNFSHVVLYFQKIVENTSLHHNLLIIPNIVIYSMPIIIYHLNYLLQDNVRFVAVFKRLEFVIYGTLLFSIIMNSGTANEFIYFQF